MFDNLSEKLEGAFKNLKGEGRLTEINIAQSIKEIRRALVAADVNYKIAKEFTDKIKDVVKDMSEQVANGGGDFEEAVVEALNDAIYNHNWRADAEAKLLFLVLDAPPHHTQQNVSQIHELIKNLIYFIMGFSTNI